MTRRENRQKLFNFLKKKFYCEEALVESTEKYHEIFVDLDKEQVRNLIGYITMLVIGSFDPISYASVEDKLQRVQLVKRMCEKMSLEEIEGLDQNFRKLYFLNKQERHIINFFEVKNIVPKGEISKFLELSQEVTKEIGELVGNTVSSSISAVEKYDLEPLEANMEKDEGGGRWISKLEGEQSKAKKVSFASVLPST